MTPSNTPWPVYDWTGKIVVVTGGAGFHGCEISAECNIGTLVEIRTRVRSGASIGANATILCGITIDEHALIGAGAVVTQISGADQERVAAALRVACV